MAKSVFLAVLLVAVVGCGGSDPITSTARTAVGTVKGILTTSQRGEYLARANEGDVEAMFRLGQAYCCGYSGVLNTQKALDWFCRAARKGHLEARLEISKIHSADYGLETLAVRPDYALAFMWFELATSSGRLFDEPYKRRLMRKVRPAQISMARELQKNWKEGKCEI